MHWLYYISLPCALGMMVPEGIVRPQKGRAMSLVRRQNGNCGKTVTIKQGDICFDLAQKNNMNVGTLQSLNPGVNCNNLQVGSTLCVQGNGGNNAGNNNNNGGNNNNNNNNNGGNNNNNNNRGNNNGGNNNGAAFCQKFSDLSIGDGTQNRQGQCSLTIQGAVPSVDRMVSTLIMKPENAATLDGSKDITVEIDINNLDTGFFSEPQSEYYATPQELNQNGVIKGHQHITVQRLKGGRGALDARQFDFFKGLNEQSPDGRTLSVTIPAGTLKNGDYRICSITGTLTHQPVIMPVAQRGSQDDCIRVKVNNGGGNNNGNNNGGNNNGNNNRNNERNNGNNNRNNERNNGNNNGNNNVKNDDGNVKNEDNAKNKGDGKKNENNPMGNENSVDGNGDDKKKNENNPMGNENNADGNVNGEDKKKNENNPMGNENNADGNVNGEDKKKNEKNRMGNERKERKQRNENQKNQRNQERNERKEEKKNTLQGDNNAAGQQGNVAGSTPNPNCNQ